MLQPVVRRTWAPRGETPILKSWDRHDRLSVMTSISVSPRRHRLHLCFNIHEHNIVSQDAVAFVGDLLRHTRRPLILVWDRWNVHRSAERKITERWGQRVECEYLPAYAPELNPVEYAWSTTKHCDLANFIPDDIQHLYNLMGESLDKHNLNYSRLKGFFSHAGLEL